MPVLDAARILRSVGEATYEWRLDTDALTWSDNAGAVLGAADMARLVNGRSFAMRLDAPDGQSRHDAVTGSGGRDTGEGVLYQVQYAFKRATGEKTWVEDTGRWFAGPDGKPLRAHGVVRDIDERHARESKLLALANFDPLTGEINRAQLDRGSRRRRSRMPRASAVPAASCWSRSTISAGSTKPTALTSPRR